MFRVDISVKAVIGDLEDPKFIWGLLEQRYVAKQEGLKSILRMRLQLKTWDEKGGPMGHGNTMVARRSDLAGDGLPIANRYFASFRA